MQNAEVADPDVVQVTLGPHDRRFGFSVVGGKEEGFPPRIDEIAKGMQPSWQGIRFFLCVIALIPGTEGRPHAAPLTDEERKKGRHANWIFSSSSSFFRVSSHPQPLSGSYKEGMEGGKDYYAPRPFPLLCVPRHWDERLPVERIPLSELVFYFLFLLQERERED